MVEEKEALAAQLSVIASPIRLALLDRLATPAFAPELEQDFGTTRQGLKRHLDQLVEAGLVETRPSKRGIFPAAAYVASATGVFALKEAVAALATPPVPGHASVTLSAPDRSTREGVEPDGWKLLVVHGQRRGSWFSLELGRPFILGRDESVDVPLSWDPFASGRHALMMGGPAGWKVRDLGSRNGTLIDFRPLPPGGEGVVRAGSILGIGRSLLLLRD